MVMCSKGTKGGHPTAPATSQAERETSRSRQVVLNAQRNLSCRGLRQGGEREQAEGQGEQEDVDGVVKGRLARSTFPASC